MCCEFLDGAQQTHLDLQDSHRQLALPILYDFYIKDDEATYAE